MTVFNLTNKLNEILRNRNVTSRPAVVVVVVVGNMNQYGSKQQISIQQRLYRYWYYSAEMNLEYIYNFKLYCT